MKFETASKNDIERLFPESSTSEFEKERYFGSLGLQLDAVRLGANTSTIYQNDPKLLLFTLSRYKFVSKMFAGFENVLEVGCQEGFGAQVALRGANKNDSRTKRFLERHGFTPDQEVCVEMDAMSPAVARDRIEAAVMGMFSGDLEAEVQLQQEHRDRIVQVLEGLV